MGLPSNNLNATVRNNVVTVKEIGNFLLVSSKYFIIEHDKGIEVTKSYFESYTGEKVERLFNSKFQLLLSEEEIQDISNDELDIKYFLFKFGERFYYCDDYEIPTLNEFKYLGNAICELENSSFPFLGVHGAFDLCNGSRLYKDWCKKAKFLGVKTLGIAEDNTLAGTLEFQQACKDDGIKSIIGETIYIKSSRANYTLKLYVKNETGWKNLMKINAIINGENKGFIKESQLLGNDLSTGRGLICVICPDAIEVFPHQELLNCFDDLYFQFDLSEWDSFERDKKYCEWIKLYIDKYITEIPPILISDAYYLDKDDAHIRKLLNKIGHVKFKFSSENQYFKNQDQVFAEISEVFDVSDERLFFIFQDGCNNLNKVCDEINFSIEVGKLRLPKYKMTEEEYKKYNGDSYEMILDLIGEGFKNKIAGKVENEDIYWDRVEKEIGVIQKGQVIDYFLILWDIVSWCKQQNILVGIGRGSAAGCLISYLLDIVKIDPIKYDLIFERFLNEGRVGKSLPDIDSDFEGERRDEVKRYIEQKYGIDHVTSIGTYSTMKAKAAITDLARCASIASSTVKFVTKTLGAESNFTEIFSNASSNIILRDFIQKYPSVIENIPLCMNVPKTSSIHAAGVVIVPEEYGSIQEQMPVKLMDGLLVSEWEGELIDKAGFLKCDILGIKQLDKFAAIIKLIKETTEEEVSFDDISLDDERVYKLFQNGDNEDVFQFGTSGLKSYCSKLKPDNIEDLTAAVALYRPGAMDTGGHEKYIRVKRGIEEPIYWFGCRDITKNTYGILVYQEQVMRVVQEIGGFTLVEADDVRKAMGKKDKERLEANRIKFIDGAIANGCPTDEASGLWETMETFARYGFNRSHAVCYAITGYHSQWFKVNYPLQFWTVALQMASDEEKLARVSEINRISNINILPPDINKSSTHFVADAEKNSIYWSITVKNVGVAAITSLNEEKEKNGLFFSFEEFIERTEGYRAINKKNITNLIICGAFDEIEKLSNPTERYFLIKKYFDYRKLELDENLIGCDKWREFNWTMLQRQLSGSGYINYEAIIRGSYFASHYDKYKTITSILLDGKDDEPTLICGILNKVDEKKSSNGAYGRLHIQDETGDIYIQVWNEVYSQISDVLKNGVGRIIIISGRCGFDKYFGKKHF